MRSRFSLVLGLSLGIAASASAQTASPPDPDQQFEGSLSLREAYFQKRRIDPWHYNFQTATARLNALQQRQRAEQVQRKALTVSNSLVWQPIGPAPITGGQTPVSFDFPSPVSGRVAVIAIDPVDSAVFVGGAQGGIWRSTDTGASWTPLTDSLGSLAIGSLAISRTDNTPGQATIYVGTGEGNYSCDSYGGVGVYKSTDSGATWSGPYGNAQFNARSVNGLAVDRADPTHLVAVSGSGSYGVSCVANPIRPPRGIFNSNDSGQTWTLTTATSLPANLAGSQLIQDPHTATTWWATMLTQDLGTGAQGGLYKSVDNGVSWTQQMGSATGLPALTVALERVWIDGTDDGAGNSVLYVGTSEPASNKPSESNFGRIYKSVNSGVTWAELKAARGYCQGQCFYDLPIHAEPNNPLVVYTGGAGAFGIAPHGGAETTPSLFMRSNNGGTTFTSHVLSPSTNTALHSDMHSIVSWPGHANEIWVGNDGGVWQSTDGGNTWNNKNTSLQVTQFEGCDTDATTANRFYGGTQDNGTNGYAGDVAWPHLDFGDGGFALIDQVVPNNLVHTYFNQSNNLIGVGYTTGGFATTQNNYLTSFAPTNGIGAGDRVLFYAPLHLDRGAHDSLYFGTQFLYRSDLFFTSATPTFAKLGAGADLAPAVPPSSTGGELSAIETVANIVPGSPAQTIFTGSDNGRVFRSIDGGLSFQEVDTDALGFYVADILVDPNDPMVVYQARSAFTGADPPHTVRKSIDGGATWADASTGLPDVPVNALAPDPTVAGTIWAGTDVGMFVSEDSGGTWTPYNPGLPNVAIFDLKVSKPGSSLLACTHGRGAFLLSSDIIFANGFEN
ncbi:MAG TPA: sialidase family protein [Rudaea sp.]|nr:sialidase family protein [Rudaea sp.]